MIKIEKKYQYSTQIKFKKNPRLDKTKELEKKKIKNWKNQIRG